MDAKAKTLDEALALIDEWTAKGEAKSVGLLGNAADVFPELVNRIRASGARVAKASSHRPRAIPSGSARPAASATLNSGSAGHSHSASPARNRKLPATIRACQ